KTPREIKEPPLSPKGMRDLMGDEYFAFQGFFEKASEIALYYGFRPIETPILERSELFLRGIGEDTDIVEKEMYTLKTKGGDQLVMRPEGTAGVMRAYIEKGMRQLPQPVMLYYGGQFFRHEKPQKGRYREFRQFGMEIIGTKKSIADAMIIRAAVLILAEVGIGDVCVFINSIGDKESRANFIKELAHYYRKHINDLCQDCKRRIRVNPLRLLDCKNPKCKEYKKDAPEILSYLSDESKRHFKEVLEYLEAQNIRYRINPTLVRGIDYYSETVFEVVKGDCEEVASDSDSPDSEEKLVKAEEKNKRTEKEEKEPSELYAEDVGLALAGGGRYDYLARAIGSKKDISGVGMSIGVDRIITPERMKKLHPRILRKPKIYFIQLGFEAKLKSLNVIEILREARIPIMHSLGKDSLSGQLAIAERMDVPYALIFGQKEAIDDTVIVRNMKNRSQSIVPIGKLAAHLKKMKQNF
ncbi:histidine--tRNA ligase, partial [bacterium]|nr:histidine--tRNA ligase [bacterium]